MSWETILPDTAKALSAPITKLIEVVSAGCGNIYEPAHVRRKAKAEADALLIMAEAKEGATDIQLRAAARRLQIETKRQENIEAVIAHAASELSTTTEVSPGSVNTDWATRFFSDCADFSDDSIRMIWGKILAGEIKQPNSFSLRTLSILKDLSKDEAEIFNTLCKYSFKAGEDLTAPMYTSDASEFWDSKGLNFLAVQRLISAGLITHHPMGISAHDTTAYLLEGPSVSFYYTSESPAEFPLGSIVLTPAGEQLSCVCEWDTTDRNHAMKSYQSKFFEIKTINITERRADGQHAYEEISI